MPEKPLHVLLADDDEDDRLIFKEALEDIKIKTNVITVNDGIELMEYLTRTDVRLPDVVFLDLNMPLMGGWEFLDCFNSEEFSEFNNIKVVVLSSTIDPDDFEKSKQYPMVIDFFSKPISQAMLEHLKNICEKE